ncbi:carboxypeptidase-like regulatory domain-containing protein [Winogradskyella psychrotolerans]|uniref:carboxypeptidase-like regulatory domain-containing protein n=1 Tax=Winogradskyella psychrotolerans TaxID=1344585 RepID=UPI001C07B615|nr:carboxypeptidase-like regulatory domain-containing protein [Winogradskyella psychrotolerans]MBU2927498.1 carboxypeptidase-like regulatory domain-containing protein [Winogradskyella psychrotolerans]
MGNAQRTDLKGKLIANDEVEGLHIQNKTGAKYTISEGDGSFIIPAKVQDTLVISGVKYQTQEIVISETVMDLGELYVQMVENVSELNEVVVGKILTGSLESDLQNSEAKPEINFYDLGIPGYTGKPLTQNERKLYDADGGSWGSIGLGFSVNFYKVLNTISGRTKKLKAIVELDDRSACIERIKYNYENYIFENDSLAENLRTEYFLFCQEDDEFLNLCHQNNDLALLEYLKEKLKVYQENRKSVTKD